MRLARLVRQLNLQKRRYTPIAMLLLGPTLFGQNGRGTAFFLFPVLFLIPGLYLIWVCFLVWFRFSPKAVLHLCGAVAFFVMLAPSALLGSHDPHGIISLIWLLVVAGSYREVSQYFVRRIFQPADLDTLSIGETL